MASFVFQVFGGNVDRNTPVYHLLHPRIHAKYVRFHPTTWYGHICMRAELYGCNGERWKKKMKATKTENKRELIIFKGAVSRKVF